MWRKSERHQGKRFWNLQRDFELVLEPETVSVLKKRSNGWMKGFWWWWHAFEEAEEICEWDQRKESCNNPGGKWWGCETIGGGYISEGSQCCVGGSPATFLMWDWNDKANDCWWLRWYYIFSILCRWSSFLLFHEKKKDLFKVSLWSVIKVFRLLIMMMPFQPKSSKSCVVFRT